MSTRLPTARCVPVARRSGPQRFPQVGVDERGAISRRDWREAWDRGLEVVRMFGADSLLATLAPREPTAAAPSQAGPAARTET